MRVNTKQQLEVLVSRLNDQNKRAAVRLVEVGDAPPAGGSAPPAAPATATPPAAPKDQLATASDPLAATKEQPTVSVSNIVDQLNAIRGGQSFKEPKVMDELKRYFDGLEESEQEALHAYLKGLAQIVSGQVDAGSAEEPKDHGVETETSGKTSRTIKPTVTRKPTAANPAKAPAPVPVARKAMPSKEDTTAPTSSPIVPKKR